jgi:hypothetical protein
VHLGIKHADEMRNGVGEADRGRFGDYEVRMMWYMGLWVYYEGKSISKLQMDIELK